MNVLDLFSGIGGFSLGLERAGMRTVAFCEIEPYCCAVLAERWPGIPIFPDVRNLTSSLLEHNDIWPNVICGGFPCQDISVAGKGIGLAGERSGLWGEYFRLIGELRPQYVIVENVSALLSRGLDAVLGDLAKIGYDAEWHCIPASHIGAPHRRDRIWIVAYPAKLHGDRCEFYREHTKREVSEFGNGRGKTRDVADADRERERERERRLSIGAAAKYTSPSIGDWWESEPDVGRVAHGVPARVDRLRALGNSVVPQVVEVIGRAIMNASQSAKESK